MAQFEGEIVIERPVEEVFDFVADERNEPRYNPRMLLAEKISSGPIALGARFRAQIRSVRRPAEMAIDFTACGDRVGSASRRTCPGRTSRECWTVHRSRATLVS